MNNTYEQILKRNDYLYLSNIIGNNKDSNYVNNTNKKTVICNNDYDNLISYISDYHSEFIPLFKEVITPEILKNHREDIYNFLKFLWNFSFLKGCFNYITYITSFYIKFYNILYGTTRSESVSFTNNQSTSYILYANISDSEYNTLIKPVTHPLGFGVELVFSESLTENIEIININNNRYVHSIIEETYKETDIYETLYNTAIITDGMLKNKCEISYCDISDMAGDEQ